MKAPVRRFRDDSNSRIGTYEAFLDLLTLFCFILIFAAAMYVAQPASNVAPPAWTGSAQVSAQDAARGAPPGQLPKTQVEIKVSRSGPITTLAVVDGPANRTNAFQLTNSLINPALASIEPSLRAASNICIAVFEDLQPVDADTLVAIQRWLAYNGLGRYQFYFVEPK